MEKYNIVFIKTEGGEKELLGRRAEDYVIREFSDFSAKKCRIAKQSAYKEETAILDGYVNVVLTLDMPLVKKADIEALADEMRRKNISAIHLGAKDSVAKICRGKGVDEGVFCTREAFLKIDDAKSYNIVYNLLKDEILDGLLQNGVNIIDKATTFIDDTVSVERGVTIKPFCTIEGESAILAHSTIFASYIRDSVVDGADVSCSHIVCSHVHARATVGPFARLRHAVIDDGCRVGDFVEVKASRLRDGVKCAHLSYVGDADIGERTNVGCGTVFCNYDGREKHKTTVGAECFLGANTNLIAPLVVGDHAFIAAGTTVTRDVENGSFTIGRVRQDTKPQN